jgi:hypothetical protein
MDADSREIIFRNMSPTAQGLLKEDLMVMEDPGVPAVSRARVFWNQLLANSAEGAFGEAGKLNKDQIPAIRVDCPEAIVDTFKALSLYVRLHGYLPLMDQIPDIANPVMREGLHGLMNGLDPLLLKSILENAKRAWLRNLETELDMIIEGLDSLAARDHSYVTEFRLQAHRLGPGPFQWHKPG